MNNKLQFHRAVLLLVLLGAAFAGLGYRLVDLQVVRHDELSAKAEHNTQREFHEAPRRGDILDATGNILATSIPVKTICADPSLIGTQALAVAQVIAPLLQLDQAAIAQKLTPRSFLAKDADGQTVTNEVHYVRLAKNVPEPTWQQIYAAMTNFTVGVDEKKLAAKDRQILHNLRWHAISAEPDQLRMYPQGPLAGQVVGFLALTSPPRTVCADPSLIGGEAPALAHVLAPLLRINEPLLAQKLTPRALPVSSGDGQTTVAEAPSVQLATNVPDVTWARICAAMTNLTFNTVGRNLSPAGLEFLHNLQLHAVYAEADQARIYPDGSLASPSTAQTNFGSRFVAKLVGRDGIEQAMQKQLSGVAGWRVTETDKADREIVAGRDEEVYARDGLDVVLTIDSAVQHIVETSLAAALVNHTPKSITGIVMRPRTGEILAMASLPNYDPNHPNTISPEARNRVITDVVEPGSTFKIVVVSGALNDGVVKLTDSFFCENGHFAFAGRILHDHEAYGTLTTEGIITKSSNIGAAKIGIELGANALYKYAWNYGFGQRTGIPLPGEARGFLYPVTNWSKVSIAQIPMGHGVAVTRLQMLDAMAAIANGGWLMQPMIVSRLQQHDGRVVERYAPQRVRQIITAETSKLMVQALKTVPTKEGTAAEAALKNYVVAGKTGTAQKAENGVYVPGKYVSSFIGFFPADNPEICISVVMDEPKEGYYGGKVCGPVFRDIAERCASYLNIPPDPALATNVPFVAAGLAGKGTTP